MNKLKLFLENFIIYGFGGIISKIIPVIMIPIVTRIMPSSEYYGISDLSNTLVQFTSAIAVMGMYDGMFRMFFEKQDEDFKKRVCSTALSFTMVTSLIVFIAMLLLRKVIAQWFFGNQHYAYVVYLSAMATLVGGTNSIIAAPTRMQNNRRLFLVMNTISPVLSYSISIPMLLAGHYVIALPLAGVLSGIIMEISFGIANRTWFNLKLFDKTLLKSMLVIAIPLLPNFLIYWIFNSSDRVMITNMIGINAAGIYSVGSKLGHVSQLIYTAFAGGWQYFAFSTMKEKNQVRTNSIIFEYLGIISFVATGFICAWSYSIFRVLFTEEYISGYIIVPYLFLAPLLQMLFQVAANQFLVVRKTWPNLFILSTGALLNIAINFCLIPVLGIEGAAIATLIGYTVSDVICVIVLKKMKLMVISKKFLVSASFLVIYILLWRFLFKERVILGTIAVILYITFILFMYRNDGKRLFLKIKNMNL